MTVSAIIVAAGRGTRMAGNLPKQYLMLDGVPVLSRTLTVFDRCPAVDRIFLVIPEKDFDYCSRHILLPGNCTKNVQLVAGGAERQVSVYNGLVAGGYAHNDIVVIHDGVRPFLAQEHLVACIREAETAGACILGVRVVDTLKRVAAGAVIQKTIHRETVWQAQTPQVFRYHLIKTAHEAARQSGCEATDDALLVERLGEKVKIIQGSPYNLKITTQQDLALADALCKIAPISP